jgi:hypothetical protein
VAVVERTAGGRRIAERRRPLATVPRQRTRPSAAPLTRTAKRRAETKRARTWPTLLVLAAGVLATGVAWFFLVEAAIDFGVLAVHGEGSAWGFAWGATVGAIVCLFLLLALMGRGLRMLGFFSEYEGRRRR